MRFRSFGEHKVTKALNEGMQAMKMAVQTSTADQFNAWTRSPVKVVKVVRRIQNYHGRRGLDRQV
jgi:hypothetical protein